MVVVHELCLNCRPKHLPHKGAFISKIVATHQRCKLRGFIHAALFTDKFPFSLSFKGLECDDMTPTLRQLFITVRQLQQDMTQVKAQITEERALRNHLQQVLMGHLESYGTSNTTC